MKKTAKTSSMMSFAVEDHGDKHVCVTWNDINYIVNRRDLGPEGVPTPYWHEATSQYCCTRCRDFGGTGRNAVKPEKNVPFVRWLHEVHAKRVGNATDTVQQRASYPTD
jgi:hypothetical protein